jgi:hypothetical protein
MVGCLTPELLLAADPRSVALFLGPTPARPKEMFVFGLDAVRESGGYRGVSTEPPEARARSVHNAGRRMVRECLPPVSRCPPASTRTKAFLMLEARGETRDGSVVSAPVGFLPKRGFDPMGGSSRNARVLVDLAVFPRTTGGEGLGRDADARARGDANGLWYQCATAVKGVKSLRGLVGV